MVVVVVVVEVEEEAEEEPPQLYPVYLHPVPGLQEEEVEVEVEEVEVDPLLDPLPHQQQEQPQTLQMINWEETLHKSLQEIEKTVDNLYLNSNSIEA